MIIDGEYEYHIAVRAKAGDKGAFVKLWKAYRPIMAGMLKCCKDLTREEKESEAALVFARKLELFDSAKVNKSPEQWTFSFMLTGGMKNARDRLKRCFLSNSRVFLGIKEELMDTEASSSDYPVSVSHQLADVVDINYYDYCEKTNPEQYALRAVDERVEEKIRKLETKLSPFQNTVLRFRRAGITLNEIADRMGCSDAKIRRHISMAETLASRIFGFDYRYDRCLRKVRS